MPPTQTCTQSALSGAFRPHQAIPGGWERQNRREQAEDCARPSRQKREACSQLWTPCSTPRAHPATPSFARRAERQARKGLAGPARCAYCQKTNREIAAASAASETCGGPWLSARPALQPEVGAFGCLPCASAALRVEESLAAKRRASGQHQNRPRQARCGLLSCRQRWLARGVGAGDGVVGLAGQHRRRGPKNSPPLPLGFSFSNDWRPRASPQQQRRQRSLEVGSDP